MRPLRSTNLITKPRHLPFEVARTDQIERPGFALKAKVRLAAARVSGCKSDVVAGPSVRWRNSGVDGGDHGLGQDDRARDRDRQGADFADDRSMSIWGHGRSSYCTKRRGPRTNQGGAHGNEIRITVRRYQGAGQAVGSHARGPEAGGLCPDHPMV